MKTQYLKNLKKWTAFMTLNGMDINALGETEKEAIENLNARIAKSDFLLEGIKVTQPK